MTKPIREMGAPDPELKNSPIAWEHDEDFDVLRQESENGVCHFNGVAFPHGVLIKSDGVHLRCDQGLWVPAASGEE